jgi:hypothetical protein
MDVACCSILVPDVPVNWFPDLFRVLELADVTVFAYVTVLVVKTTCFCKKWIQRYRRDLARHVAGKIALLHCLTAW